MSEITGMEQGKQDDSSDRGTRGSPRVSETVRGEIAGFGEPIVYSYHMVHTQESIRLHDLRLDTTGTHDDDFIWRVFGAIVIGIYNARRANAK